MKQVIANIINEISVTKSRIEFAGECYISTSKLYASLRGESENEIACKEQLHKNAMEHLENKLSLERELEKLIESLKYMATLEEAMLMFENDGSIRVLYKL